MGLTYRAVDRPSSTEVKTTKGTPERAKVLYGSQPRCR